MPVRRWNVATGDKNLSRDISERFGIPRFAAHLLVTRGFTSDKDISAMLSSAELPLSDPFSYIDMDKAVERINRAIESFEAIVVYGDYDVDGVTSTALLYSYLSSRQANVSYMLPSRDEDGYGLSRGVIDRMHENGTKLIITVDNGIAAELEIYYASQLGIDVVVTDHHSVPDRLPKACAVVDPRRPDCAGSFESFAGVGVAFKLVCALEGESASVLGKYCDLVALGTVADVVPLVDENRTLVVHGINKMRTSPGLGLGMLMAVSGVNNSTVTAGIISFVLAPRINSAGRVGRPDKAVQLLLSQDVAQARELSEELQSENAGRHELERAIAEDAWKLIRSDASLLYDRVTVICGDSWNSGVIGIFAARLCEALGRPCIVLSCEDGIAHGSGRCFGDFSLFEALCSCSELLITFGGHKSAAGMTIKTENIPELRRRINEFAAKKAEMPVPELSIDCMLPPVMLNMQLVQDADILEPFGCCNNSPVVGVCGAVLREIIPVGQGKHQRMVFERDGCSFSAMYFGLSTDNCAYYPGDRVDVAFSIGINEYRGTTSLNLIIKDLRLSGCNVDEINDGERLFERLMRNEPLTDSQKQCLLPERADFERVYRYLLAGGFRGSIYILAARLGGQITYSKLRTALEAMRQCGLLSISVSGGAYIIRLLECGTKVQLECCDIMQRLMS